MTTYVTQRWYYVSDSEGNIGLLDANKLLSVGVRHRFANATLKQQTLIPLGDFYVVGKYFPRLPNMDYSYWKRANHDAQASGIFEESGLQAFHNLAVQAKKRGEVPVAYTDFRRLRSLMELLAHSEMRGLVSQEDVDLVSKSYNRALITGSLPEAHLQRVLQVYEDCYILDDKLINYDRIKNTEADKCSGFHIMLSTLPNAIDKQWNIYAYAKMPWNIRLAYDNCLAIEAETTRSLANCVQNSGGYLDGLDNRIKSPTSLVEKVTERARLSGISTSEAVNELYDALRYTAVFPEEGHSDSAKRFLLGHKLSTKHKLAWFKNYWSVDQNPYNGINTTYRIGELGSDATVQYEVQVHTPASLALKSGELHSLYEQSRSVEITTEKREELLRRQFALSSALRYPDGIRKLELPKDVD